MHPILSRRTNLTIYLGVAVFAAALPATALALSMNIGLPGAFALSLPPTLLYAVLGLTAWFPCRALPIGKSSPFRTMMAHLLGAALASGLWLFLWQGWIGHASRWFDDKGQTPDLQLLFLIGILLYLFSVAIHYLILAIQSSHEAEQTALKYQVLAREAELRAFKAQIDPHFLFNSLNSISSLTSSNPSDARRMTQQLGDFFRRSLRLGGKERITLGEELDLASLYLSIEEVRFGDRLSWEAEIDGDVRDLSIPPLLLQPLVENAVRHGIAGLVEGGAIRIKAGATGERAWITIENDRDPDHRAKAGEGIGIANVRGRLETSWQGEATMNVSREESTYRVEIRVPFERNEETGAEN